MEDDPVVACGICPIAFRGWALSACEWHDKAYTKGSWAQANMSRYEADQYFYKLLLELANQGQFQAGKKVQAYLMYKAVRLLGAPFWEGRQY